MIKLIKIITPFITISLLMLMFPLYAELPDFTKLVEKHSAAVVNISTKKSPKSNKKFSQNLFGQGERNEALDELMKHFLDKNEGGGFPGGSDTSSLGSGFIISQDGYVVTNYHVIAEADEIIVKLNDRRELSAKLIGSDERSDVALLKVEAENLPALETGSSDDLKVGEWVIAIGSPFGFDHSVTAGIVSAKGRSLPSENYVPFIQTDVAINPGNSGGPLFNLKGEVVGINSQIFSRTGGFMGVSFAIPVDVAKRVIEQLKEKGKVSRGWLGVYIQEVTRELALSFGLDSPRGALIVEVIKEGPAMGVLKQGDIVLEFNGHKIKNASALPVVVGETELNKDVEIVVRRGGKTETLILQLLELPSDDEEKVAVKKEKKSKKVDNIMGMELANINDATKKNLDIDNGVIVKRVLENPAKSGGVEQGDILLMFNGKDIDNLDNFSELTKNLEVGKIYALLVLRSDSSRFLAIKIEK